MQQRWMEFVANLERMQGATFDSFVGFIAPVIKLISDLVALKEFL